eukprot:s678_g7.t1
MVGAMFVTVSQMIFASAFRILQVCASQTVAALPVWAYFSVDSNGSRCHCGGSSLMAQSSPILLRLRKGQEIPRGNTEARWKLPSRPQSKEMQNTESETVSPQ